MGRNNEQTKNSRPTKRIKTNGLKKRNLVVISKAVTEGIREAARLQQKEQAQWSTGRIILVGSYGALAVIVICFLVWSWYHRPTQPVVLDSDFDSETQVTIKGNPLRLERFVTEVVGISSVPVTSMPIDIALPISESTYDIVTEFLGPGYQPDTPYLTGGHSEIIFAKATTLYMTTSNISTMVLPTAESATENIAFIRRVRMDGPQGQSAVTITVLPPSESQFIIKIGSKQSNPIPLGGDRLVTLRLAALSGSASPTPDTNLETLEGDIWRGAFRLNYHSETSDMYFDAWVSELEIKGGEGIVDLGEERIILAKSDILKMAFPEQQLVKITDKKINLGEVKEVWTHDIRRNNVQILPRQISVNTLLTSFIGGIGGVLLGLFPVFLRSIGLLRI